jgi:phage FluMu protein Com
MTIESLRMVITCPCGTHVLLTLMSQIYQDARCPHCGKVYVAHITIAEVPPENETIQHP